MTDGAIANDPGWGTAVRRFLPFVLMPALVTKLRSDQPPVVLLRAAFLAFVTALFGFLVVLLFLFPLTAAGPTDPIVYALVAVGPLTLAAIPWARGRVTGACAPPSELAQAYSTSVFLSIAFAESAALLGFVASFLADALWPYVTGMLVSLVGFAAIAPTAGRLEKLDAELSRRGCQHSLRAGLFTPGSGTP